MYFHADQLGSLVHPATILLLLGHTILDIKDICDSEVGGSQGRQQLLQRKTVHASK